MRSLSKLFIILILLISLGGCKEKEAETGEYEYIAPANDSNLFSYLNKDAKELLFVANSGESLSDAQMDLFQSKITDLTVEDINGNMVTLSDYDDCKLVFEIVQVGCSHCKLQITQYNETIISGHPELTFIQFFATGDRDSIINFYAENGLAIPENVVVLLPNDDLLEYVLNIGVEYAPTLLCFDDGLVTWAAEGVASPSEFDRFYSVAFERTFNFANLTDEEGNSLFIDRRSPEDVKNDLSDYNVAQIELLDNDGVTPELCYELIGQNCDYSKVFTATLSSEPSISYDGYEEKDVALLYLYMTGLEDTDRNCLDTVNKIIAKNPDLSFIAMIIDEDVSSYAKYLQYGIKLDCPVISSESTMPQDFSKIGAYNFPTVVFIEKGTMTGAYSSYSDSGDFSKAKELFIGEKSVAHLDNNQSAK